MITLKVENFDEWRESTLKLLIRGVRPEQTLWNAASQCSLLDSPLEELEALPPSRPKVTVPPGFMKLAANVACHRNNQRWERLYAMAWHLAFNNHRAQSVTSNSLRSCLLTMSKSVSIDRFKIKALVRFKELKRADSPPRLLAWFKPRHLIVSSSADYFVKRFKSRSWSLLTPDQCAHWDGQHLHLTQGVHSHPPSADDLDELWSQYLCETLVPARLKLQSVVSGGRQYWPDLQEASVLNTQSKRSA